jgi:hypothetical protein
MITKTKAFMWCQMRETFLVITEENFHLCDLATLLSGVQQLAEAINACRPVKIHGPGPQSGDQGTVYFSDGSIIDWDWDDGCFECEGTRYIYPFDYEGNDPLYWHKELFK